MRKEIILKSLLMVSVIIGLSGPLLGNHLVFAQYDMDKAAEELAGGSPIKDPEDIFKILAKVVQYIYTAFFIVAVIFIIVAAFSFLTAQGNPEKINSARNQILWACVAIAIALISVAAAQIIKSFITP